MTQRENTKKKKRKFKENYTRKKKQWIADKIRKYSMEDIVSDYQKLVEIGCQAKKMLNKNAGNKIIDYYTFTERLNTVGNKGVSFFQLWKNKKELEDKKYIQKILLFEKNRDILDIYKIWYKISNLYFGSINIFRPLIAMDIYCMYQPTSILDMTAGWFGRGIGAAALNIPKYIAIDNNRNLKTPYQKMVEFLNSQGSTTHFETYIADSVKFDYSTLEYDMVFTSPPYYDIEKYSYQKEYTSMDDWDQSFYYPLFTNTYKHLKPGGYFILNIPKNIYERVCKPLLGPPSQIIPLSKNMRFHKSQTNVKKKNRYQEYIYVWNKK
jgi:hypothetical protein